MIPGIKAFLMVLPSSRGDLIRGHRGRCLSLPLIFCLGRLPGSFSTHVFALVGRVGPCACPPYAAGYVHPLGAHRGAPLRYSLPATFPPRPLRSRRDAARGQAPCRSQRSLTQRHLWRRPQRSVTLSALPHATCNIQRATFPPSIGAPRDLATLRCNVATGHSSCLAPRASRLAPTIPSYSCFVRRATTGQSKVARTMRTLSSPHTAQRSR